MDENPKQKTKRKHIGEEGMNKNRGVFNVRRGEVEESVRW